MATTQVRSEQLGDGQVKRADLNTATSGSAVVTKVIQGTGITISATGADAGTGDATINAAASAILDVLGSTRGQILYRGASAWLVLAPGTLGYVLTANGAGADPSWNQMNVATIDTGNSTTATLTTGSTYTGAGLSTLGYGSVSISVLASHASAADGLAVEQSQDNTNWDIADYIDIAANQALAFDVNLKAEFYRVVYVNGGTGQTTFRLEAKLNPWALPLMGPGRSNAPSKFAQLAATSTSDTAIVAAPGSNKSILVRGIGATNDSATLTRCSFKDGSTVFYTQSCAASGGGFGNPLKQEKLITENTAVNIALSTGVTSVYTNCEYVIVKS